MVLPHVDFDTPWKDILNNYFQSFLALCLPKIAQAIDWSKGYEALDKELSAITKEAELGKRLVDKLMKVYRKNGEETWVLLHVEVQGSKEMGFAERMYVYNYRIFDRYHKPVVSLAILVDDKIRWRPQCYKTDLWGCSLNFEFITVKLLDYETRQAELVASANLFAVVLLAHLAALKTKKNLSQRLAFKLSLTRSLYEKGLDKKAILNLYTFIDWVMALPKPLELAYANQIEYFEEEKQVSYITSAERFGIEKGEKTILLRQLQRKFGVLPPAYQERVEQADSDTLLQWADVIIEADTLLDIFESENK